MEQYTNATSCSTETSIAYSDAVKQEQSTFDKINSASNCIVDSGYHSSGNIVCSDRVSESKATVSTSNDAIPMQTVEHGTKHCKSIPPVSITSPMTCHSHECLSKETCNGSPRRATENPSFCDSMGSVYASPVNSTAHLLYQHEKPQIHSSLIKLPLSSPHTPDSCYTSALSKALYTNGHDTSHQDHQYAFTKATSTYDVLKPRVIANNQSNPELKADWQDLAIKIEFCLMFGYTPTQIRAAISKLSWKASKNDILAELSSLQSAPVLHNSCGIPLSHSDYNDAFGSHCFEGDHPLAAKGIDSLADNGLQARGPLLFENGHKEEEAIPEDDYKNLRPIVIDGSNVAMSHGNKQFFSCKGILLAVDFFRKRNHSDITVFVPTYRKESRRPDAPIRDREILTKLEEDHILVYTPSRCIDGKRVTCYDDRFILKLAQDTDGIIVSNDNFRDLKSEKPEWKELIEKRVLMYSFVSDRFMPPDDPLGRNGPIIDNFLRKRPASEEQRKPQCPYGKKCTYGKKCKYFHPESSRSITDSLKEQSSKRMKASNLAEQLASELMTHDTPISSNSRQQSTVQSAKLSTQNSSQSVNECREQVQQNNERPTSSSSGMKLDNPRLTKGRVDNLPLPEQSCCRRHCQCNGCGSIENMQSVPFPGQANRNPPYGQCSHEAVAASSYSKYQASPNHLADSLAQKLTISGQMHGLHSQLATPNHSVPNGHQVCYDAQGQAYSVMTDPSRPQNSFPASKVPPQQVMYSEVGMVDFHSDNHSNVENPIVNQRNVQHYQRNSHGNMQVFDGRNGEAGIQPQHMNMATPYQRVPASNNSYNMSARPAYHPSYNDAQYQSVPQQLVYSYAMSNNTHSAPRVHQSMIQTPYYAPSLSPSTGSDGSLSLSYHFLPDGQMSTPLHSNMSSSNSSTSKTYPQRNMTRRINSSPGHQVPLNMQQQFHSPSLPNANYSPNRRRLPPQAQSILNRHNPNRGPPLSSPEHPRHHLYQNLCGLLDPSVVTKVMSSNPNLCEPKEVIKLCLRESD